MSVFSFLFYSIPEAIALCCLCLSTTHLKLTELKSKIMIFAVVWSLINFTLWNADIDPFLRIAVQLPFLYLMGFALFRITLLHTLLFFSLGIFLFLASELVAVFAINGMGISYEEVLADDWLKISTVGVKNLGVILLSYYISKKELTFLPKTRVFPQNNRRLILIIITSSQLFVITLLNVSFQLDLLQVSDRSTINLLSISLFILIIVSSINIVYLRKDLHKEFEETASHLLNENIQTLFTELRSQRHDFHNHLQTIQGLAYLKKTEEIKNYLNDLGKELQQVNQFMTANPILSSILLSKNEAYKEQGVEIQTSIQANLKELEIKPIHLINILGNLLDNARDALLTTNLEKKTIYFSTIKLKDQVRITVRNEQPILTEEMIDKILTKGFSTKGTDGLGLSIVQNISQLYNAEFLVTSDSEGGTRFEIIFPLSSNL